MIVDNGSEPGSCEAIQKQYPAVDLIKNPFNLGYAGGNNVGMNWALKKRADYVWLLNNDTTVAPDCLKRMVEMAEGNNEIGLVSPIVYYFENPSKWQFAGSHVRWDPFGLLFPDPKSEVGKEFQTGNDVCLWGTALLIKNKVIETIGYLKDEYFAYWEDTEYSLRSMRAGFKNAVCKNASIFHKKQPEKSNGTKKGKHFYYFMQRNKQLLGNEYIQKSFDRLRFNIRSFAELSHDLQNCDEIYYDACLDGGWQGIKGITGAMNEEIKMPKHLKRLLLVMSKYHPVFFADMITLNVRQIWRRIMI